MRESWQRRSMSTTNENQLTSNIRIPFFTERDAEIAYNTLRVDKEPPRGGCVKTMFVEGSTLEVHFTAADAKKLRVAVNSFLDTVTLVVETIQQFGG
ncbi:EKC/KEOPS complex subunit Lage3-like [Watersipora subatra]|uniref:EKC/KEOPS complex subunit Lage3-like n=1 Tax=Watersipora subatra TaxID=2589382 RepID=UPI00355B5417